MRARRILTLAGIVFVAARLGHADIAEAYRIPVPPDVRVRFLRVSPDGRQLVAVCADAKLRVWALPPTPAAAPLHILDVQGERVSSLVYSFDGTWMAAGTREGTVAVFRAATGEAGKRLQTSAPGAANPTAQELALSPDGAR